MRFRFDGPRRLIAAAAWIVLFAIASSVSAEPLRLVVWKQRHLMQLKRGDAVVSQYRVSLGYVPIGRKELRGDGRTPVGIYYIHDKLSRHRPTGPRAPRQRGRVQTPRPATRAARCAARDTSGCRRQTFP